MLFAILFSFARHKKDYFCKWLQSSDSYSTTVLQRFESLNDSLSQLLPHYLSRHYSEWGWLQKHSFDQINMTTKYNITTSSGKFFSLLLALSWPFPRTCREETGGRKRLCQYVCYLQEHILPNCFTFWQISVSLIPSLLKKYRWNLYPKVTDDWANQR